MRRRTFTVPVAVLAAAIACGPVAAQSRFDYGGRGGGYSGEEGLLFFVEAGLANPRNTDNIVAAAGPNVFIPEWDDDPAGRAGLVYQLAGGARLGFSLWTFATEQNASAVGSFDFPIGPASGFGFDVETEIDAHAVDATWSFPYSVNEVLGMEWSVGLRYAGFEETTSGSYETFGGLSTVSKSNQGDMLGARIGGRATYRRGWFSASGALGLSLLDGEIESRASLSPQPAGTAPLALTDDSRSGSIVEMDLRAAWHSPSDVFSVWLGYEHQVWGEIAADLARNLPDSEVISRDRDSVRFSWVKVGTSFRF